MNPSDILGSPSDNTGKMMTRRIKAANRTTVILSYSSADATSLRALAQSIRIKDNKFPSLSLLARRSLHLYAEVYLSNPRGELAALNEMVTPVPQPAKYSKQHSK
jgi:hypothetical protein